MVKQLLFPTMPGPIFFLVASCLCVCLLSAPQVSGFSSGRSSADSASQKRNHQHHVGLFSSEEAGTDDLFNEIRHEVTDSRAGGGGGLGLHSMDDVMRNVALGAEDLAEEGVKKCHTMRVPIDYDSLKNDFLQCSTNIVTQIITRISLTRMTINARETELDNIESAVLREQSLTEEQKQFLTNSIFEPVCTTLVPAMSECDDPKYTTLTKASQCKPDFEKDAEELSKTFVKDLCKDHGAWIFEYLDSKPQKCAVAALAASRSEEHQARLDYLRLEVDRKRPGQPRRLESHVELCNITETVGASISDLLITACKDHPRPGEILLDTFKNTRNFWNAKCGSGVTRPAWWSVWVLGLGSIVIKWSQSLLR